MIEKITLLFSLFVSPLTADESWTRYCNERFSQCVDVPAGLNRAPPPANGDGQRFYAKDGFTLSIFAHYNLEEQSLEAIANDSEGDHAGQITYRAKGKGWFALSGLHDGMIFYRKSLVSKAYITTLIITYPQTFKSRYDATVRRSAQSLSAAYD